MQSKVSLQSLRSGIYKVWQYRLWSFQGRDTKLERFLAKNQYNQRKLLNFENLSSGKLSKIVNHFRKEIDLEIDVIKKRQ